MRATTNRRLAGDVAVEEKRKTFRIPDHYERFRRKVNLKMLPALIFATVPSTTLPEFLFRHE